MQSDQYWSLIEAVRAFVHVESLQGTQGFGSMIERIVNDNRLNLISASTLIELKSVYHRYIKFKAGSGDG